MKYHENNKYADMLKLPHHVSKTRPRMSMHDRAAQFAPFAALTGHDAAIQEAGRITAEQIFLDENHLEILNQKLSKLQESADRSTVITVTYFQPDSKKQGGSYVDITGHFAGIDAISGILKLKEKEIPLNKIYEITTE